MRKLCTSILALVAIAAGAQTQINPTTQIQWTLLTGSGTPSSLNQPCTSEVGMTVNITAVAGAVTAATINSGGSGIVALPQTVWVLGGGGTGAVLSITAASGGAATAITLVAGGTLYTTATGVRVTLANYGQPFQNLAVTPNTLYTCGNDGWAVRGGAGGSGFPITLGSTSIAASSTTTSVAGLTIDGVSPTTMGFVDPTSSIQTQLNSKQATGNYITALTGDGTASGPGSAVFTFATVNSAVGTCGDATHVAQVNLNAKGLTTGCTAVSIAASGIPTTPSGALVMVNGGGGAASPLVYNGTSFNIGAPIVQASSNPLTITLESNGTKALAIYNSDGKNNMMQINTLQNQVGFGLGATPSFSSFSAFSFKTNAGTASQTTTAVTGVGTSFNANQIGGLIAYANGHVYHITAYTDSTHITVDTSATESSQNFSVVKPGIAVDSDGNVIVGDRANYVNSNASRLLIFGGFQGTNIDALPDANQFDAAQFEAEASDYGTSGNSIAIRYIGPTTTLAGTCSIFGLSTCPGTGFLDLAGSSINAIIGRGTVPLDFGTNSLRRMRIDGSGNVGIGTGTSSLTNLFNVGSAFNVDSSGNTVVQNLTINGTCTGCGGSGGTVTNVSSADANATVATGTTTPVITIVAAPKLTTARAINGVNFDGTAAITVTAAAGTLTGTALNSTVVTSSLTNVGTLIGGATGAGFTLALSSSTLTGNLPNANLATQTANTVLGALTATTPSGLAVPSCSATGSALNWTSGTGFGCFTGYAPLASPTFTGVPAAPTATVGTNTTQLATTAFVIANAGGSPSFSAVTSGTNTGATMNVGTGASLNFTGSGTINATSLLNGTWAIPGVIGSTTPNSGSFTQVTSQLPAGSVGIGGLAIGNLSFSDTGMLESLQGSANSYLQQVIQNTNSGSTASASLVVANNSATATTNFGEFGINSSGFTGSGAFNAAGTVYMDSTTVDLAIGTTTANAIHFVYNSGATDTATINVNGFILPGVATSPSTSPICPNGTGGALTNSGCSTGGTPTYPLTITGGVSGGVVYANSTTQLTVSAAGTAGQAMLWGGAGAAPTGKALAGSGSGITTGPTSGVTSLDMMESTGTAGQIADSGVAVSDIGRLSVSQTWLGSGGNIFRGTASGAETDPLMVYNSSATNSAAEAFIFQNANASFSLVSSGTILTTMTSNTAGSDTSNMVFKIRNLGSAVTALTLSGAAGNGVFGGTVTSALGNAAITSATGGTGITSVTCATAPCTVSRGSYTIVGGTATTGTIATLVWPTTTTAWVCSVDQNGGTGFLGIGHGIATATGMTITAGVTVIGVTLTVDYSCVP